MLPRHRVALALAILVLAVLGPLVPEFTAQTGSRYSLQGAIVDDGTISLDGYEGTLTADDWIERDGHLYSDKAPLQPLLGVPFYASARLVGAEPAQHLRVWGNLGAWWVTLWTSVVPAAALCALMFLRARQLYQRTALAAALSMSFGTILLTLGSQMYSHVLSALLGYGAWLVIRAPAPSRGRLLAAGALAGAAVTSEYTLAVVAVLIGVDLLRRGLVRRAGWYLAGGVPFAAMLAVYQQAAYGSPFRTSYGLKETLDGSTIVGTPSVMTGLAAVVGSRGLLVITPVVIAALVGAFLMLRGRRPGRADAAVGVVVLAVLLVMQAGWPNPWGGEVPGPRYLAPALPFLVGALALAWERWPFGCRAAAVFGGSLLGLGVLTSHVVPHGASVLGTYVGYLEDPGLVDTVFTMALGPAGWVVQAGLVGGALWLLVQAHRADQRAEPALTPPVGAPASAR